MKTETLVLRHWEDVVFQNRNKAYGAYTLRKAYSNRVILGFGTTVAIFAAWFIAMSYFSNPALHDTANPPVLEGPTITLQPPPVFPPKDPPKPQAKPPRATQSLNVVVTSASVDTPVEPSEPVTASSDDTGTGGAVDSNVEGIAIAPIVEPVYVAPTTPRDIAEIMPRYEGGTEAMMKFIQKKIRVPNSVRSLGVAGTVYVRFVVRPGGKVTDVEVVRGIAKDCDKEAMRVIEMLPGWIAGMQNGTSVPVRMVLPIKFMQK